MDYAQLRNTVFGEVLVELLEAHGHTVTPAYVGFVAEEAGLDGWEVLNRMASADAGHVGYLDYLAKHLDLSPEEKRELAVAYTFEARKGEPIRGRHER